VVSTLRTLDQAARVVTGKKLSDNIKDLAGFVSGALGERKGSRAPAADAQDLADCELLGVSPTCSERVARLAFRAFAEAHHPDRPGDNEQTFKLGQAAYESICQKRGWSPR
jgi:DnaJ-class molecular chaperone